MRSLRARVGAEVRAAARATVAALRPSVKNAVVVEAAVARNVMPVLRNVSGAAAVAAVIAWSARNGSRDRIWVSNASK